VCLATSIKESISKGQWRRLLEGRNSCNQRNQYIIRKYWYTTCLILTLLSTLRRANFLACLSHQNKQVQFVRKFPQTFLHFHFKKLTIRRNAYLRFKSFFTAQQCAQVVTLLPCIMEVLLSNLGNDNILLKWVVVLLTSSRHILWQYVLLEYDRLKTFPIYHLPPDLRPWHCPRLSNKLN
jgi:hypothetical protein